MKPGSPWKIALLLGILFLPAFSYYLISRGKNNFKTLAIYGPKTLGPVLITDGKTIADTLYHTIPDFEFTDQYNRKVTAGNLAGNISVTAFFFTTCQTICPQMSEQLARVQSKFIDSDEVKFFSFTVDPETDTVSVIAAYAEKYHAVKDKWYFLTGAKSQLYELARNGYFLAAIQGNNGPQDFNHSEQLVLVDKDKRIRGYYDGTDITEVNKLMDEIMVLQWEYKSKQPKSTNPN